MSPGPVKHRRTRARGKIVAIRAEPSGCARPRRPSDRLHHRHRGSRPELTRGFPHRRSKELMHAVRFRRRILDFRRSLRAVSRIVEPLLARCARAQSAD